MAKGETMRLIKFRVWDNHYNRWEKRPCAVNKKGNLFIYNVNSGNWFEPDPIAYKVVWFTGLCDKNGKEIYEGDIIKQKYVLGIWEIIYEPPAFKGKCLSDVKPAVQIIGKNHKDSLLGGISNIYPTSDDKFEAIGNIHENLELLKKNNF